MNRPRSVRPRSVVMEMDTSGSSNNQQCQTFEWKIDQLPLVVTEGPEADHQYHVRTFKSPEFKCKVGPIRSLTFRVVLKLRRYEFELLMESLIPFDVDITLALALDSNNFHRAKKPFNFKTVGMVDGFSQYESLMEGNLFDLYSEENIRIPGLRVTINILSTFVTYKKPNFLMGQGDEQRGDFSNDMSEAFENEVGANLKVICIQDDLEVKSFNVQRNILISRSEVFKAMFTHDCEENATDTLRINDMTPGALEDFLRFLYTDKVNNMNDNCEELINAATKYNIPFLKLKCEQVLCESLDDDKVLKIAMLCDSLGAELALDFCLDAIAENFSEIIEMEEDWDAMIKKCPDLLKKIMRKVALKMGSMAQKIANQEVTT